MKTTSKKPVTHTHTQFTVFAKKGFMMLFLHLAIIFFANGVFAQSKPIILSDSSECIRLHNKVHQILQGAADYKSLYDTGRYCIEQCPLLTGVWHDFSAITSGVQYMSNENNRWPAYREWLKKVLYLNMDTNYYCSDVDAILSSFQYFNSTRGFDENGSLAVVKFLLDSNRCLSWLTDVNKSWKATRQQQFNTWRDTVKDASKTPFSADTLLPTIDSLGLGILRGPQNAAIKDAFTPSTMTKIRYLLASENPFTDEAKLRFNLADAEYMKIEIFDLLGNKIYTDSKLFGEGEEEWRLDGKAIAKGSLYARLSTMGGEVRTIKLIHQ